jgi:glyoxylase-like metal-dependent hydrolase (beta-lactamase superfamily II)
VIELLAAGWCRHPECSLIQGGSWRSVTLPSGVALLRHPKLGIGLFDAGYSQRFIDATRPFPERLYRWITPPVLPHDSTAVAQLAQRGIAPTDVRWIVLSHLHADHIAGILDFPRARILLHHEALATMRRRGRWANLLHGTLPALLPDDLDARTTVLHERDFTSTVLPGWQGHDLAGDGTLFAVPLPGHAAGQMGLFARPNAAPPTFLVADAAWTTDSIRRNQGPPRYTTLIFESASRSQTTLKALHRLAMAEPDLCLIPSHCPTCWPTVGRSSPPP